MTGAAPANEPMTASTTSPESHLPPRRESSPRMAWRIAVRWASEDSRRMAGSSPVLAAVRQLKRLGRFSSIDGSGRATQETAPWCRATATRRRFRREERPRRWAGSAGLQPRPRRRGGRIVCERAIGFLGLHAFHVDPSGSNHWAPMRTRLPTLIPIASTATCSLFASTS